MRRSGTVSDAAVGVVAAAAAVVGGTAVATLIEPASAPLTAIGSTLIDLAPTPVKEWVVRNVGTYDKPLLIALVAVVVVIIAVGLGVQRRRRPRLALAGIVLLGVMAGAAALLRPGADLRWAVGAAVSILIGVAVFVLCAEPAPIGRRAAPANSSNSGIAGATSLRARRRLVVGLGVGVVAVAVGGIGTVLTTMQRAAEIAQQRLRGLPPPQSAAPEIPAAAQVPGNTPFQTASADFYRVDISLTTPAYDATTWSLTIDGLVDRPVTLSYDELMAMPMIERDITLTCVSNEVGGKYVSTGRWLGVRLRDVVDLVRPHSEVSQMFSYSLDSGYTCSTPYEAVTGVDNAMIAVGLNGEVLPAAHGYPARLIIPGLFGFVSATKWLSRLEFTRYEDRTAYWTERGWATDAPILTQSRIDVPKSLSSLPKDKPVIAGVAWAQTRGIAKVEIQIDDGPWEECTLAADAGIQLWRQWSYVFRGGPGAHTAQVRATDLDGQTQPEQRTKVFPSGATGWHQIRFTAE